MHLTELLYKLKRIYIITLFVSEHAFVILLVYS